MCYAILEISYATSERGTKNIETEEQYQPVVAELQANPNVTKIRVFTNTEVLTRQSVWECKPTGH